MITAVLVSCNVMEAAGTGFDKIVEEYKAADEAHRLYICSGSDHFTLVLPDLTYMEGIEEGDLPSLTFFDTLTNDIANKCAEKICTFLLNSILQYRIACDIVY